MCYNHQPYKEPATENWQRTIPRKEQRLIRGAANDLRSLEVGRCSERRSRVPSSKAGGGRRGWRGPSSAQLLSASSQPCLSVQLFCSVQVVMSLMAMKGCHIVRNSSTEIRNDYCFESFCHST